jgi:uncharacterized protein (TIGR03435 family)
MKKLLSITGFVLFFVNAGWCQSVQSVATVVSPVNQLCPDFVFDTLLNYNMERLSIADLKGKFVIIDFWGTFCLPCIKDFPKIEKLQKRFGDTLQVLLVATDGYEKAAHFYEARKKNNKPMALPCAIHMDAKKYFQVRAVSTYVWIDDQGYVKAITDDTQLTEKNIADFISRKKVRLREVERAGKPDHKKYLVTVANEMDSSSVIYNSSLTKYLPGIPSTYYYPRKGSNKKVNVNNMPVSNLYQIAFGDSTRAVPTSRTVIEAAHPEKLQMPKGEDYITWRTDNTYCYELKVPAARQNDILKIMQDDLKRLFGLNVFLEKRIQKCLVLKAEKNTRFATDKASPAKQVFSAGGCSVTNTPFSEFAEMILHYNQDKIVLDETGITANVDIALDAQMNDVDAMNQALKKYGLSLQFEDRPIQMLVIKDPL